MIRRFVSPVPSRGTYRPDIDGLRALAVLAVLAYHYAPGHFPGGFIGVDVFFVISGYLITGILAEAFPKQAFSAVLADFYMRRIRRIFPALALVLLFALAAGWLVFFTTDYASLGKHVAAGAGFIQNLTLWHEAGYFDAQADHKPLLHLWSLAVEEQFYIFWPLVLWAALYRGWSVMWTLSTIALLSFGLNLWAVFTGQESAAFYWPITRAWELMAGAWLAINHQKTPKWLTGGLEKQAWLGLALILTGFAWIKPSAGFPGFWALLPIIGATLLINAGHYSAGAWLNRTVFSLRPLVWVGLISYPLYLWHWVLYSTALVAVSGTDSPPIREIKIICALLSFILAWLTYRFVEKPIRKQAGQGVTWLLAACIAGLGSLGLWVYVADGVPSRLPPVVNALATYRYDYTAAFREGSCFLRPEQTADAYAKCPDSGLPNGPLTLLWGDSHAAALYAGLETVAKGSERIRQRTASGCPPILDYAVEDRPHCQAINQFIFDEIRQNPPAHVVLTANWSMYDWTRLQETIARLRLSGIKSIQVIGPVPQWQTALPDQLMQYVRQHLYQESAPSRMKFGLQPAPFKIDAEMAALMAKLGVPYASPISVLCNTNGCLTMTQENANSLTAWDYGHLTETGAQFLMQRLY